MATLNTLINRFEVIAASHSEIDSFNWGMDFDINNQPQSNFQLRQMWVQPVNSQLVMGRSSNNIQRTFRIYVFDLERNDEKNRISVWNQCELVLLDILRLFGYGGIEYKVVNNPILVPFQESFAENVSGYWCEIVIQTPEIVGECEIPGF